MTIRVIRAGIAVAGMKNVAHVNTTRKLLGTYTRLIVDVNDLCSLKMHLRTMNFSVKKIALIKKIMGMNHFMKMPFMLLSSSVTDRSISMSRGPLHHAPPPPLPVLCQPRSLHHRSSTQRRHGVRFCRVHLLFWHTNNHRINESAYECNSCIWLLATSTLTPIFCVCI